MRSVHFLVQLSHDEGHASSAAADDGSTDDVVWAAASDAVLHGVVELEFTADAATYLGHGGGVSGRLRSSRL